MATAHRLCQLLRTNDTIDGVDFSTLLSHTLREETASNINKITYAYIAPIIITVGLLGDVLTVVTLTHPLLRKSSSIYTYLTLLAMTDMLTQFSVIPMIMWLLDIRACSDWSSFFYAHIGFPLANALMGSSVWVVVFLTLSQYMAVCRPFAYGLRSKKVCYALFAIAYMFNFCIYAPWAIKKSVHDISGMVPENLQDQICPYVVCDAKLPDWFVIYEAARELVSRIVPFLLVAFLNIRILITYRHTKKDRMERLANSQKRFMYEKSEKEEKRLFILLFAIVIIFFVCTIPAAPLTILVADAKNNNVPFQIFRAVVNTLEFTKFALNFYFYCLINPDIRRICFHVFCCKKITRPPRVKGQPTTPISMYTRSTKNSTIRDAHKGSEKRRVGDDSVAARESVKRIEDSRNSSVKSGRDNTKRGVPPDALIEKLTVIKENESVTSETGDRV